MTTRMTRRFAVAAVAAAGALAAFGAVSADAAKTAVPVAGRTTSPYAGEFTGPLPDAYDPTAIWGSIEIASNGNIVITQSPYPSEEKITGEAAADGSFEIYGSWNPNKARWWVEDAGEGAKSLAAGTIHYVASAGTLVLGGDGNLYGTTTRGTSFVWWRK